MRTLRLTRLLPFALLLLPLGSCGREDAAPAGAEAPSVEGGAVGPTATGEHVLLRDDFSDPSSGWTVRDGGDYRNVYADGRYLVQVDNAASSYVVNVAYRPEELEDVRIEVDATRLAGAPSAGVGIDCRRQGADQTGAYYGDLDAEGEARIVAHGDEQEVLAEVDRPGLWREGTNRLRFDCAGERLALWVNGERVLTATDCRWRRGRIGLRAGGGSGEVTEVAFDDLIVSAP
jgi:hypothetical protein